MLWSVIRVIFKTSSVTPDFFYVFNLVLSFSTCSQSFNKICVWEVLGANVLNCFSFSLWHHILSSLHQRRKSCLKVHARFCFILKSNINTENGDARVCLNERLSCTIAANFLEILALVHTWRFNVFCFEVLDANKVPF